MKHITSIIFVILICLNSAAAYASTGSKFETVILSSESDPYYSLAEEISDAEGIPVHDTFDEATEAKPVFLLWVAAPTTLSESALIDFCNKLNHLDSSISVGIISGKTIEDARNLWKGMLVRQCIVGNTFSINKPGYPWLFALYELIAGIVLFYAAYYLCNKLPEFRKKARTVSEACKL